MLLKQGSGQKQGETGGKEFQRGVMLKCNASAPAAALCSMLTELNVLGKQLNTEQTKSRELSHHQVSFPWCPQLKC